MGIKNLIIKNNEEINTNEDWKVTPWQNDTDNPITKSNVDYQDDLGLEDLLENGDVSVSSALTNQLGQFVTQNGIYSVVENYKNVANKISGNIEIDGEHPEGTIDPRNAGLTLNIEKLKRAKYKKNVKLSSKFGLYNSYMNLLGNAAGLYVGSLGKTSLEQVADVALTATSINDLTLGLGGAAAVRIAKAIKNQVKDGRSNGTFTSVDIPLNDILSLNLANFFTLTDTKPGLTIRQTNKLNNFISTDGSILGQVGDFFKGQLDGLLENSISNSISDTVLANLKKNNEDMNLISDNDLLAFSKKYGYYNSYNSEQGKKEANTGYIIKGGELVEATDNISNSTAEYSKIDKLRKVNDIANSIYNKTLTDQITTELRERLNKEDRNETIFSSFKNKYAPKIGSISNYLTDWQTVDRKTEGAGNNGKENLLITSGDGDVPTIRRNLPSNFKSNGGLYIEPFYNNNDINCFFIPFEFNANITGGGVKATYQVTQLLARNLMLRTYTNSDSDTVNIETTYLALSERRVDDGYYTDNWMSLWSVEEIREVENLYRSLMYPAIESNANSSTFIRPPIIRIVMPNDSFNSEDSNYSMNDLFKYPESDKDENYLQITKIFDNTAREAIVKDKNKKILPNNVKRYIATDLQIQPLEAVNNTYGYFKEGTVRNGFKLSLTLAETTKNFLDNIPDHYVYAKDSEYYRPWEKDYFESYENNEIKSEQTYSETQQAYQEQQMSQNLVKSWEMDNNQINGLSNFGSGFKLSAN